MRWTPYLLVLCFTVSTVAAPPVTGQVPDSLASSPGNKSAVAAGALEYLVPTLGHAYAGDWDKGLPPLLVFVAGIAVAIEGSDHCVEGERCAMLLAGVATMVTGKVWGIYSAVRLARSSRAKVDVGIHWEPQVQRPGLRLTWHW